MANNFPTTFIKKLQVGARGNFQDKFTFKIEGKDGAFGLPEFTEAERDICWPVGDFPNPDWTGGMIYNLTNQRIQYNTGSTWFTFDVSAPPTSIAAFYQQYPDDATYVVNHGVPVNGSVYYNTAVKSVRVYSNGNWYNDLTPEPWANSKDYIVGQIVWTTTNQIFRCVINHTSSAGPATIVDDIVNWVPMGAHVVGALDDVDTTGVADGDVLEWVTDKFVVTSKGTLETGLTLKELAADPSTPAAGYVNIYAKVDKRIYLQDSTNRVTLLEVPLNVVDHVIVDTSVLAQNTWLEVIASTAGDARRVQIFDAAGFPFEWGVGAAAAEVTRFLSGAGSNESTDIEIPAGSRLAIRTADAGPDYSGTLVINLLG